MKKIVFFALLISYVIADSEQISNKPDKSVEGKRKHYKDEWKNEKENKFERKKRNQEHNHEKRHFKEFKNRENEIEENGVADISKPVLNDMTKDTQV